MSAEAYGEWNQKRDFTPPVHVKSESQKQRLAETLAKSFLFNALREKETATVLQPIAMQLLLY